MKKSELIEIYLAEGTDLIITLFSLLVYILASPLIILGWLRCRIEYLFWKKKIDK